MRAIEIRSNRLRINQRSHFTTCMILHLSKGRKIDFRVWVLIISTNPSIIYIYKHTMLISCVDLYDKHRLTKENFVCNGAVTKNFHQGKG